MAAKSKARLPLWVIRYRRFRRRHSSMSEMALGADVLIVALSATGREDSQADLSDYPVTNPISMPAFPNVPAFDLSPRRSSQTQEQNHARTRLVAYLAESQRHFPVATNCARNYLLRSTKQSTTRAADCRRERLRTTSNARPNLFASPIPSPFNFITKVTHDFQKAKATNASHQATGLDATACTCLGQARFVGHERSAQ